MDNLRITGLSFEQIGPFNVGSIIFPKKTISDLAEVHIFTGENGTGKTTILSMLSGLFPNKRSPLLKRFRTPNSNYNIKFSNDEICSVDRLADINLSLNLRVPFFLREYYQKTQIQGPVSFSFAFFAYSGSRKFNSQSLQKIEELKTNPLGNAIDLEYSSNVDHLIQWIANTKTKQALSLMKKEEALAKYFEDSILRIESCLSEIFDFDIKFEIDNNPLGVFILLNEEKLDFNVLSDGYKSVIGWLSDLLMRMDRIAWVENIHPFDRNFILFLDEIDVHIHPALQRKLLPIIQKLFRNAQIFISTHSPFVIGSVDGAWIHNIKRDRVNNTVFISNPVLSEDSKSYPELLNDIFGVKSFFGIEVEKRLDQFKEVKHRILRTKNLSVEDKRELSDLINYFKQQDSLEIQNMISMEMSQLKRLVNVEMDDFYY